MSMQQNHTFPSIWVNVTTLINWRRPVVGIIRVEQQFCLWLTQNTQAQVRYCSYDRAEKNFYEHDPVSILAHLERIAAYCMDSMPGVAGKPTLEERLRQRGLSLLGVFPSSMRFALFKLLARLKPLINSMISLARQLWMGVRPVVRGVVLWLRKQRHRLEVAHLQFAKGRPVELPAGAVYVSLGLDWDYGDMVHLYRLKQEKKLKCLFFCYDVIPVRFPHLCVADVSRQFAHYFADLAWSADLILCISQSSRRDLEQLLQRLGVPCPETRVIRLGEDTLPGNGCGLSVNPAVERLLKQPYILFVSTIERRKNHETLYRAYARLAEEGLVLPDLIFVGMPGWGVQELLSDIALDPRVQGRIHLLHHVSDAELAELYQHTCFTVYPSLYEGWGLPVAESLAFGKFCLCSDTSSLPEVGGEWVEYLDPWDIPAWVERLRYYIGHPEEVARRNAAIAEGYRPHPWAQTAETIYQEAVRLQQTP